MYAIRWNQKPHTTWTGQGYCDAPWLTRTYADRGEAERIAARIDGRVVPWQSRNQRRNE